MLLSYQLSYRKCQYWNDPIIRLEREVGERESERGGRDREEMKEGRTEGGKGTEVKRVRELYTYSVPQ